MHNSMGNFSGEMNNKQTLNQKILQRELFKLKPKQK